MQDTDMTSDSSEGLLYVETLNPETHTKFVETTFKPYLTNVYNDLALRSTQLKFAQHSTIDKNTFVEFANLPGAVSDRFFTLACEDSLHERVELEGFLKVMLDVYGCSLEPRMKLVFQIFDFNQVHLITPQEVRMILSYIPFN